MTTQIITFAIIALVLALVAKKFAGKGNNSLHALAKDGKCERLEEVLRKNFNVNEQDEDKLTPLHLAVLHDHVDCVALFLKAGANVNLADDAGDSPLHTAVDSGIEMVQLLVKHGAKIDSKNDYGSTPLQDAVATPDNLEIVELLVSLGANIENSNRYGSTLLHEAALNNGTIETGKFLIGEGVKINAKDEDDLTAYEIALENENYDVVDYLDALKLEEEKA